ncbi:hypothetical protein D3H55_14185 [Bacillus salacetis]|uniref:Phosphoribulokinase/uridine kinase domain-containing protein n=1 Tax=Bacillus salacetis TaxID=2315464 RepID=A0A3A1QWT0_9BACI|nr:hypothetical protein [Bacillus salacetis]RIW32071.1 hypothetical protein D3H55_14185 [Bacillus salacetis]
MEQHGLPLVIVVAAVSGGGKTTITNHLQETLPECKALFFDDYDFDGPDDMMQWIENGCKPEEWNLSPLVVEMKKLLSEPLDYIIVDFPFAYLHRETRNLIDFAVFIDTPLDLAMARRMMRDHGSSSSADIRMDMESYIKRGRQGYLAMLDTVKLNSDFIVDGTQSIPGIASAIIEKIKSAKEGRISE